MSDNNIRPILARVLSVFEKNVERLQAIVALSSRVLVEDTKRLHELKIAVEPYAHAPSGVTNPAGIDPAIGIVVPKKLLVDLDVALTGQLAELDIYQDLVRALAFTGLVAAFDAACADATIAILKAHPKKLSASKELVYSDILKHGSMDALIEFMAEREMNELAYANAQAYAKWVRSRLGIEWEKSGTTLKELVELRADRNILIHNNGLVNRRYLDIVRDSTRLLGDRVRVDNAYWAAAVNKLLELGKWFIATLDEKHG